MTMAFDQGRAEENLRNVLYRVHQVRDSLENDIIGYRRNDTITSEEDEYKTMRDIRYYLLRSYKEIDGILTDLDRY